MKTNEKLIAIAAIVVLFVVGMSMGCVDKEVQLQINNTAFRNIAADTLDDIAYQLVDIKIAGDSGEFTRAKLELAEVDALLNRYITEFEEMNVAENTLPFKKALISTFEETRLLCVCYDAYIDNPTVDELVCYNMQAINVTNQMEIAAMLGETL